jgi:hypothetical protein
MFGYQPRSILEKLRVSDALEGLPAIERALSSGEISWSAVRELTRVAAPETEHEWLELRELPGRAQRLPRMRQRSAAGDGWARAARP